MGAHLENAYDEAVDNFFTGDIHLIPDGFLFDMIAKYGLASLIEADVDIGDVQRRWEKYSVLSTNESSGK